ncbi:hypothetical protein PFISCL1PPCAC_24525 [Pristionchus fissidentatus]|uniref:Uncharacterized protein n=1 Tax=Pristionchus fissidentatus TaxID=1538716 RepID=A0AAV5WPB8_9BILA|nr:hypothetical protein PFISCL1PPCAC_24525 [Pristionchus fissidentatus]
MFPSASYKQGNAFDYTYNISMPAFPSGHPLPTTLFEAPPQIPEQKRPDELENPVVSSVESKDQKVCECSNQVPYSFCGFSNEKLARFFLLFLLVPFCVLDVVFFFLMAIGIGVQDGAPLFMIGLSGMAISTGIAIALFTVKKQVQKNKTLELSILIGVLIGLALVSSLVLLFSIAFLLTLTLKTLSRDSHSRYSNDLEMAHAVIFIVISASLLVGLRTIIKVLFDYRKTIKAGRGQ